MEIATPPHIEGQWLSNLTGAAQPGAESGSAVGP